MLNGHRRHMCNVNWIRHHGQQVHRRFKQNNRLTVRSIWQYWMIASNDLHRLLWVWNTVLDHFENHRITCYNKINAHEMNQPSTADLVYLGRTVTVSEAWPWGLQELGITPLPRLVLHEWPYADCPFQGCLERNCNEPMLRYAIVKYVEKLLSLVFDWLPEMTVHIFLGYPVRNVEPPHVISESWLDNVCNVY